MTSANVEEGQSRLIAFLEEALQAEEGVLRKLDGGKLEVVTKDETSTLLCTVERDLALAEEGLDLLGIDHPLVKRVISHWKQMPAENIGASVASDGEQPAVLTLWLVHSHPSHSEQRTYLIPLAVDIDGTRVPSCDSRDLI